MVGGRTCLCLVGSLLTISLVTEPASAQEDVSEEVAQEDVLDEVIVTAQKREQNLQDVAISLSVLSEDMIDKRGLEGFRDWADYVPGITMFQGQDSNRRTGATATIRGVNHVGKGQLYEGTSSLTTSFAIGQVPFFNGDPFLYDLSRIEVLRGPQGTLFGISSMGGTVRFIPNDAHTDRFEAEIGAGGGLIAHGGNKYNVEGMVNVPVVEDTLAMRLSFKHSYNDGFIDLYQPGLEETDPLIVNYDGIDPRNEDFDSTIKDANVMESTGARFALTFTPTDRLSFQSHTTWQKSEQGNVSIADLNDSRDEPVTTRFSLQPQDDEYVTSSIEASYDLGLGILHYVGGYYWSHNREVIDSTTFVVNLLSRGGTPALDVDGPGGLPSDAIPVRSTFPFSSDSTIYTSEVRLQGENKALGMNLFGSDMTFDYVAGVFYQDEARDGMWLMAVPDWNANKGPNTVEVLTEGGMILGSQGGSDYKNKAIFGDLTLHLTDNFSIGGGIRYFDQQLVSHGVSFGEVSAPPGEAFDLSNPNRQAPGISGEDGITPRFNITYQIDDERMLYFTAAQGKRLGQQFGNPDFPEPDTRPECVDLAKELLIFDSIREGTVSDSVWSYDVGLKSRWLDNRLLTNVSLYYLIWSDYQQTVQMSQFSDVCNILANANAGEVTSRGIELETSYAPTENWLLNAAISYIHQEFTDVPLPVSSSIQGVLLKEGDELRGTAPLTAAIGAEYRIDLPEFVMGGGSVGYIRADWRYVDERMFSYGDPALMKAHPVRSRYFADAYNLTDVRMGVENEGWALSLYVANLFDQEVVFEAKQDFFQPNIQAGAIGQPRTVGFSVRRSF